MQCNEVHAYLAEHLAGRLADRLSGTVQTYVRMHMQSCRECCEQLEDFEEMQSAFRRIPIEPCDSEAMRLRFKRFMSDEDARAIRASVGHLWPHALPRQFAIGGMAAFIVVAGIFAVRQMTRSSGSQVVYIPPPNSVTVRPTVAPPIPAIAEPAESNSAATVTPQRLVPHTAQPSPAPGPDVPATPIPPDSSHANVASTPVPAAGIPISISLKLDTGERLPYKPDTSIVFSSSDGKVRVPASPMVGNLFQAVVPPDASYSISVSNVASGYAILSIISGTNDLMNGGRIVPGAVSSAPLKIVVTLRKQ